jgi:peroxiredoxin (alkyl hydroperoxide reductase subunit C)
MPKLDEPAPDFLADSNKGKITLAAYRGKWIVLFAYPADFTPICEMDLLGFARNRSVFDSLGVQFIGWSVDTVASHLRWVGEVKDKTGVEINYPLIADPDRKLATRYEILHQEKGVANRGIFIVDPEGILKFSATYALDVGRSVKEVERIIKVLQRARELRHLGDLERASELSRYQASSKVDETYTDPLEEAKRIIGEAEKGEVTLRLIGGLAIRLHCHGKHSGHLREYHDIDLFGLAEQRKEIELVFVRLGYSFNLLFNMNSVWLERLQFVSGQNAKRVDVFLDQFSMEHTLDFKRRIRLDDLTIPVTDLLLTKLQMEGRIEARDEKDIVAVLEDHDLGLEDSKEMLNVKYLADLCSRDWGLFRTVTGSLQKIRHVIENDVSVQCVGMEADELIRKVDLINASLTSSRKGLRWRARKILGERVKWYSDVEVDEEEVG